MKGSEFNNLRVRCKEGGGLTIGTKGMRCYI